MPAEYKRIAFLNISEKKIINKNQLKIKGEHNVSNALAAMALAETVDVPKDVMTGVLKEFVGLAHRCQLIKVINDVTWYNDSKATNIQSVIVAINSFESPIILILGGKNKNSDFRLLLPHTKRHVKHIVSYGEAGGEIATAIGDAVRLNRVSSLSQAVASAHNLASPGDIILMSPGCASFDEFKNFEERGKKFTGLVNDLAGVVCD